MDQPKRRRDFARGVARSFLRPAEPFAIRNARKIDARGVRNHTWIVSTANRSSPQVLPMMISKLRAAILTLRMLQLQIMLPRPPMLRSRMLQLQTLQLQTLFPRALCQHLLRLRTLTDPS